MQKDIRDIAYICIVASTGDTDKLSTHTHARFNSQFPEQYG